MIVMPLSHITTGLNRKLKLQQRYCLYVFTGKIIKEMLREDMQAIEKLLLISKIYY